MGDVLTPGQTGNGECAATIAEETPNYLIKDKYLGEFETGVEKEIVRSNLNVPNKDDVYSKLQVDNLTLEKVNSAVNNHLSLNDPHQIMPKVEGLLEDYVKTDGTTPFISPLTGVDPITDFHLTTKRFVTNLILSHLKTTDPHNIMPLVEEALKEYVKLSLVYLKKDLYTKKETDELFIPFIRKDGSTPFLRPQTGVTPTLASHLSTKGYVDDKIYEHLVDVDPHGFLTLLNLRLSTYYTKSETYSKALTYSRALIDAIINDLIRTAATAVILEHINDYDPHGTLREIYSKHYVQRDGSVPFTDTQKGVAGIEDDDLVILSQLMSVKADLELNIDEKIANYLIPEPIWITSGPVETTVGFIEDNSLVPPKMTFQLVMDAIFYGKTVSIISPPTAVVGETVEVKMSIHSNMFIEIMELYQNDKLIGSFNIRDFKNGVLTYMSEPIFEDTVFTFKVFYKNGDIIEVDCLTKVAYAVFIGLLPKWVFGSNVTYDYLMELVNEDPINNVRYAATDEMSRMQHIYNFSSPTNMKHPFIVVPTHYPNLRTMVTESQNFGLDAFDIIDNIPLHIPNNSKDIIYKIYIYREALVAFNSEVIFKFES